MPFYCGKRSAGICIVLGPRVAYLVIRARLARLARKAGLVGSFIFVSRACRARLACLAHDSRTTSYGRLATKDDSDRLLARMSQCAVTRRCVSRRCQFCLRSCRDTPVATEAAGRGTVRLKPSGPRPTRGGSASRRAATGVTREPASNVTSRGPTGLTHREGRWSLGEP